MVVIPLLLPLLVAIMFRATFTVYLEILFLLFFVPKIWEFAASSILVSGCCNCIIMIANSTKQIQCKCRNTQIFGQSYIFWEIATLSYFLTCLSSVFWLRQSTRQQFKPPKGHICNLLWTVTMLDHVDVDKAHTEDLIWGWKKTLARCHTSAMDTQNSVCFWRKI